MSTLTFKVDIKPLKAKVKQVKATVRATVADVTMEQLSLMQNHAVNTIYSYPPSSWYRRTGNLGRNYVIDGSWTGSKYYATLSNRTDYFTYVEKGTGIYHPNGRQTRWLYQTSDGVWHWTKGMQGRYSMSKAFAEYRESLVPYMEYRLYDALR